MGQRGVNKTILVGNVGNPPELKQMPNGDAVVNLSIATSEAWKGQDGQQQERTEWHRCVAFRKLAEIIGQYVQKGSKLCVEGKLRTRKYQDNQGVERYVTEIIVDEMQMLDSKNQQQAPQQPQGGYQQPQQGYQQQQPQQGYQQPQGGYQPHSGAPQGNPPQQQPMDDTPPF